MARESMSRCYETCAIVLGRERKRQRGASRPDLEVYPWGMPMGQQLEKQKFNIKPAVSYSTCSERAKHQGSLLTPRLSLTSVLILGTAAREPIPLVSKGARGSDIDKVDFKVVGNARGRG